MDCPTGTIKHSSQQWRRLIRRCCVLALLLGDFLRWNLTTDNSWRRQNERADVVAQEEKHKAPNLEDYVRKENHCSITAFIVDMDGRE